jgi:glyoxalase superfamily protein
MLVPILRTFPGTAAREFYCEFLGFHVDWEHRFELGLPLYCTRSSTAPGTHFDPASNGRTGDWT